MSTRRIPRALAGGLGRWPGSGSWSCSPRACRYESLPSRWASAGPLHRSERTARRCAGRMAPSRSCPPLERLAVRPISPRFLSEEERVRIAGMASRGDGPTVIGQTLGRAASTISRELRRNLNTTGQYRPFHAQVLAAQRRRRPKQPKIASNAELRAFVVDRLAERWSPQQISRALRAAHPDEPAMRLATESIYQALYWPSKRPRQQAIAAQDRPGPTARRRGGEGRGGSRPSGAERDAGPPRAAP